MLQVMLGYGIPLDPIAFNAALNVEVIGRRDEEARRIVPPSKEVLRQLIELADVRFGVKLFFAAATGVRAGELHVLRWRHLPNTWPRTLPKRREAFACRCPGGHCR